MPSERLVSRVGNLQASPSWLQVPLEDKEAFIDRVFAAAEFTDLPPADQAMIRAGELEVSAGLSPVFQDPATWGDWTAIEAALDAGDDAALDRALERVGPGDGNGMDGDDAGVDVDPDGALSAAEEAELADYDDDGTGPDGDPDDLEGKALGVDDDGWVG